jgi:hypothetical protein
MPQNDEVGFKNVRHHKDVLPLGLIVSLALVNTFIENHQNVRTSKEQGILNASSLPLYTLGTRS